MAGRTRIDELIRAGEHVARMAEYATNTAMGLPWRESALKDWREAVARVKEEQQ